MALKRLYFSTGSGRIRDKQVMQRPSFLARCFLFFLALVISFQPVMAQSILRDAETEAFFADISADIIRAAGLEPRHVQIILINDPEINAFVAGGQIVYVHSGLITAAKNANEVQGVIAHELGHVAGGHVIRINEGAKESTSISILSLVLGVAAMAAGAGSAGAGIMAAGQQAALGKFLAFSRTQEASADAAGASYLSKAGVSGKGLISFFKTLQNVEFRYSVGTADGYGQTHPLTGDRIANLQHVVEQDAAWSRPSDPAIEARFQRVKAKLMGFVADPPETLKAYPVTDTTIPARYARAYAWHRSAYPDRALDEANALLQMVPHDPYFLELKGQILLESGRPKDALPILREANDRTLSQPLIAALFGHALVATEDKANLVEATRVLKAAVARDNENPFAWYQLGVVYERQGDLARAQLATAERYSLMDQPQLALRSAQAAMTGIPQGTPDWIRAQDIAMASRGALEAGRGRRK
jgi:predicted Zn-dependent protease